MLHAYRHSSPCQNTPSMSKNSLPVFYIHNTTKASTYGIHHLTDNTITHSIQIITNNDTPFLAADVAHTELAHIASGRDVIEGHIMDVSIHILIWYGL